MDAGRSSYVYAKRIDHLVAAWVAATALFLQPKAQRDFPRPVNEALFATVVGRISNVLMVAIALFICGAMGYFRQAPIAYWGVAFLGCVTVVVRAQFIAIYRQRAAVGRPLSIETGLVIFGVLAVASSACFGIIGFVAFTDSADTTIIIVAVLSNIGTAGAVAARNCGTPRIAKGMLLFSQLPLVVGSIWADDAGFKLLLPLVPAMTAGLFVLIDERYDQLVELFFVQQKLSLLSNLDPLTQISNRRHFDDRLGQVAAASMKTQSPYAVLMIDVDYFKAFNDQYGHPVGDDCLRQIADTLRNNSRGAGDLVARYGGEEFVVLLDNADAAEAAHVADRLRHAVLALAIPHTNRVDAETVVTISVGSATTEQETIASETLMKRADQALYSAKAAGRNQIAGFT